MLRNYYLILALLVVLPLNKSLAIPPPDLIISGLQSVLQVFGVAVAFLVSAFFLLKDSLKLGWQLHRKKMILGGVLLFVISVAALGWFVDMKAL